MPLPARRPTQTSEARSLHPISQDQSSSQSQGRKLNPHSVVPTPQSQSDMKQMNELAEERRNIQMIILQAAITIQRVARGFITRIKVRKVRHLLEKAYNPEPEIAIEASKQIVRVTKTTPVNIAMVSQDHPVSITNDSDVVDVETKRKKAAHAIQLQVRVMFARNKFKAALYKLILFKSIVESRAHKHHLLLLKSFDKLTQFIEDLRSKEQTNEI